jgi:signal transduction histidine kinase
MKSSETRRSKKASRHAARKPINKSRAKRHRHGVVRGAAATSPGQRERAPAAQEESVRRDEYTLGVRETSLRAREVSAETGQVERLMDQMREANERLIVAAIDAHNRSDEADVEAAQARTELDSLMRQLRDANDRLTKAAAQAHTMAEDARQHKEQYRRLSGRLLQLQDEERRRLAVDLHDSTAQRLAALTMNLDLVDGAKKALGSRSRRALAESRSLAKECSREVRTLAYLLHPPLLDEAGLLLAVRWFAEGFSKRSGIHVVLDLADVGRLPAPIETALFRVVQESLTNVHRHAHAATASIRLMSTANEVALDIQDQGRGLSDPARQNGARRPGTLGVGIQGMRERISQLNGTFDIEFTDKGTTVRVSVPLTRDAR